jgi:hypothetical protein
MIGERERRANAELDKLQRIGLSIFDRRQTEKERAQRRAQQRKVKALRQDDRAYREAVACLTK